MPNSKKSASGNGNIRKKTVTRNGKPYTYWEAWVTVGVDPRTGKQKQRSVSGKTQKEVAQKLRQLTVEVDKGTYQEPSKMTVGEWLDIWLDQYLGAIKPRTADSYRTCVNIHLKAAFGVTKLTALQTSDIQALYTALLRQEKPLSAKSTRNLHGVLHKALQQAVELGYMHNNPSTPCKLPKVEKAIIRPLDGTQIRALMQAVKRHRFEFVYLVTLFTSMREGVVLGLKWDYVDFSNGTILIGQQLQRKRGGNAEYVFMSPKNGKMRKVTPAPFVLDILRQQQARQAQWKQAAGEIWEDSGLVFTNEIGQNLSPLSVYKSFKVFAAQIGCPDARFHDLRHSYAVAAIQSGDDIKTVQENLGHHTAAFTLDVYGHVTDQMRQASAERMQRFIAGLKD